MRDVGELAKHRAIHSGVVTALAYLGILIVLTCLLFVLPYLIFSGI